MARFNILWNTYRCAEKGEWELSRGSPRQDSLETRRFLGQLNCSHVVLYRSSIPSLLRTCLFGSLDLLNVCYNKIVERIAWKLKLTSPGMPQTDVNSGGAPLQLYVYTSPHQSTRAVRQSRVPLRWISLCHSRISHISIPTPLLIRMSIVMLGSPSRS